MKQGRIEGSVDGGEYVIAGPSGDLKRIPLEDARSDPKLAAAIKRNGWKDIPDGGQ